MPTTRDRCFAPSTPCHQTSTEAGLEHGRGAAAGATVTAVLLGSAPTGITTVAALLDDAAVPPAAPMPTGVVEGDVGSLHDATVKVNVAATRRTCDSRMR